MNELILERRTIVAHGRLAMRQIRLDAARNRRHGLQIMTFEQLAVRLAGGFARSIDDDSLRAAIQTVLPSTPLGELETIMFWINCEDEAQPFVEGLRDVIKVRWENR